MAKATHEDTLAYRAIDALAQLALLGDHDGIALVKQHIDARFEQTQPEPIDDEDLL